MRLILLIPTASSQRQSPVSSSLVPQTRNSRIPFFIIPQPLTPVQPPSSPARPLQSPPPWSLPSTVCARRSLCKPVLGHIPPLLRALYSSHFTLSKNQSSHCGPWVPAPSAPITSPTLFLKTLPLAPLWPQWLLQTRWVHSCLQAVESAVLPAWNAIPSDPSWLILSLLSYLSSNATSLESFPWTSSKCVSPFSALFCMVLIITC